MVAVTTTISTEGTKEGGGDGEPHRSPKPAGSDAQEGSNPSPLATPAADDAAVDGAPERSRMPRTADPRRRLFIAIARAQAAVAAVDKDGVNDVDKYKYATAESLIKEAKAVLAAFDLSVLPLGWDIGPPTIPGATAMLNTSWLVTHVDGGELEMRRSWPIIEEPGRPADKALAGADTTSLAYFLRDFLQIPRVEEGTGMDDAERSRRAAEERKRAEDERRKARASTSTTTRKPPPPKPPPSTSATTTAKPPPSAAADKPPERPKPEQVARMHALLDELGITKKQTFCVEKYGAVPRTEEAAAAAIADLETRVAEAKAEKARLAEESKAIATRDAEPGGPMALTREQVEKITALAFELGAVEEGEVLTLIKGAGLDYFPDTFVKGRMAIAALEKLVEKKREKAAA